MNNKGIWEHNTPYSKLLITVGIVLLSTMAFTFISILASSFLFHISIADLQNIITDFENPGVVSVLKLIQTLTSLGSFVIPPFLLAYLFSQNTGEYLFLKKGVNGMNILLVILCMMAAVPLINFLAELNSKMALPSFLSSLEGWMKEKEAAAAGITKKFLEIKSTPELILNLGMMALIPALGEELLFRGIVQRIFSDWTKNVHGGIWISSVLFSAMHMQFYGFIPRLMLGVLLGYMLVWSGSLWLPIIAHFFNNASAVIFIFLFNRGSISIDPDKIGTDESSSSYLIAGTVIFLSLLYVFYGRLKEKNVATDFSD
ncbi:MAG TPA: CPBP family intramembrane glutamic endopeptidase [Bacteroidia bacterium]|nr:CPBP family intramembrane glutamic endopeptidase [Bacteroidia bacterium]